MPQVPCSGRILALAAPGLSLGPLDAGIKTKAFPSPSSALVITQLEKKSLLYPSLLFFMVFGFSV